MRTILTYCLAAGFALAAWAGLGIGPGGPGAWACDHGCRGHGFHPAPAYHAPPVYSYSYAPGAYPPVYRHTFYTTRVNIFRGPRWGYAAAYYNPRGGCGRARACAYRAYMSGPIIPISRVGRRRW
jgi:hypothetical protein